MPRKTLLYTTIGKLSTESEKFTRNAFDSWKRFGFDVVVFTDNSNKSICNEYGFLLDSNYEYNEFGLPLVKSLFKSIQRYSGYDVYCYLNSDIEFPKSPQYIIDLISNDEFLLVGQRLDVYPDGRKELHNPGGIDYYFYTPDFWKVETDMPDFAIARGRFDHWLMGYAFTKGNGIVVDLTNEWVPIHHEPENRITSDFVELFNRGDSKLGYQILRNTMYFAKARLHGQVDMAKWYVENGELKQRKNNVINEFGIIL